MKTVAERIKSAIKETERQFSRRFLCQFENNDYFCSRVLVRDTTFLLNFSERNLYIVEAALYSVDFPIDV